MQCYICLEEMGDPWDARGFIAGVSHACCGRHVHKHCEIEARKHSLTCPWCRADLPTNIDELKTVLRAGVRANRGVAMMILGELCNKDSRRLSVALLERAIKRLSEGDEWSCKLASCAKISLVVTLVEPRSGRVEIHSDVLLRCLELLAEAAAEGHPGADPMIDKLVSVWEKAMKRTLLGNGVLGNGV